MVSRKRNKGKDRKAQQQETKIATASYLWRGWATGSETFIRKTIQCKQHGCVIPGANHPVISFMDDFTAHYITSPTIVEMVTASFKSHPEVWKEDVYK